MDYTPNYHLPQWEMTDRIRMEDFNAMNQKLDGSLNEHSTSIAQKAEQSALSTETINRTAADTAEVQARQAADAALSAQIAKCGNCRIYSYTYTGNGKSTADTPISHTFPGVPLLIAVAEQYGQAAFFAPRGLPNALTGGNSYQIITLNWNGSTVSWYSNRETSFNEKTQKYRVVALLAADE